ncbi:hypothetical protein KCTC52924_03926 [Arenibacter antarcticus]
MVYIVCEKVGRVLILTIYEDKLILYNGKEKLTPLKGEHFNKLIMVP